MKKKKKQGYLCGPKDQSESQPKYKEKKKTTKLLMRVRMEERTLHSQMVDLEKETLRWWFLPML